MMISVLISILLQLGIISNVSSFDEANIQQYVAETAYSSMIIVDTDPTGL